MQSFKEYLAEANDTNPDLSGFKRNAKIMLDNGIFLYRGVGTPRPKFLIDDRWGAWISDERTIERAPSGRNIDAMRISDKWEIPKRKLSYFATRDKEHAGNFAIRNEHEPMLIIPADNVNLFAWMATDFNMGSSSSFSNAFNTVAHAVRFMFSGISYEDDKADGSINKSVFALLKKFKIKQDELSEINPDDDRAIKFVDALLNKMDEYSSVNDDPDFKKNIVPVLKTIAGKVKNAKVSSVGEIYSKASQETFKIKTFSNLADIPKKMKTADELWFNGKYLSIVMKNDGEHEILSSIVDKE